MPLQNPSKHIRESYITVLKPATGLSVWDIRVPLNEVAPAMYILLDGQTKQETVNAKRDYFEWLTTIDVSIYYVGKKGYSHTKELDDVEEKVMNVIRYGVPVNGFSNKNTRILESMSLNDDTSTQSIERRVIKFESWLSQRDIVQ